MLKAFGEPENTVAIRIFDFLFIIFWPQRLIDQLPPESRYRAVIRIVNFFMLTTLIMFAFPPLAGALIGAATLSAVLAYLPAGFSALIAFCIVGVLYTTVFQYFNRSDVTIAVTKLTKDGLDYLYKDGWLSYKDALALSNYKIKNIGSILPLFKSRICQKISPEMISAKLNSDEISSVDYKKILSQILKLGEELNIDQIERIKSLIRLCPHVFSIEEILNLTPLRSHNLSQVGGTDLGYEEYVEEYRFFREMMSRKRISLEQGLALSEDKDKLKKFYHVACLISFEGDNYHPTLKTLEDLSLTDAMKISYFRGLISDKKITLKEAVDIKLNDQQSKNLKEFLKILYCDPDLKTRSTILPKSYDQDKLLKLLEDVQIKSITLLSGIDMSIGITIDSILELSRPITQKHIDILTSDPIRTLLKLKKLPIEIFLAPQPLTDVQLTNLTNLFKNSWFARWNNLFNRYFCFAPVLSVEDLTVSILKSSKILSDFQLENFKYFYGMKISDEKRLLAVDEILTLDENQASNLKEQGILSLVQEGHLTVERAKTLTTQERDILSSTSIWWIANLIRPSSTRPSILTVEKALELTEGQRSFIYEGGYLDLLDRRVLAIEIVLLIHARILTNDQAMSLSTTQKNLLVPEYSRLVARQVTLAQLGITFTPLTAQLPKTSDKINEAQSTHTETVHESTSESAKNLYARYKNQIEGEKLEKIIQEMTMWITDEKAATQEMADWLDTSLPKDNDDEKVARKKAAYDEAILNRTAAASAILELTAEHTVDVIDKKSNISIKQLLCLIWCGIHDETEEGRDKTVSAAAARSKFMQALYDHRRGYNLNEKFEEKDKKDETDYPICGGGTFNKLIEAVQTVLPCVSLIFKSQRTTALKLPKVVKQEVEKYLIERCEQAKTPQEIEEVIQLLERTEKEGCSAEIKKGSEKTVFGVVRQIVRDRMLEEFGSIYMGEKQANFELLINSGEWVDLREISYQAYIEKLRTRLLTHASQQDLSSETTTLVRETLKASSLVSSVSTSDMADSTSPHLLERKGEIVTIAMPSSFLTRTRAPSAEFFSPASSTDSPQPPAKEGKIAMHSDPLENKGQDLLKEMRGMISPLYAATDSTSQDIYKIYKSQLDELERHSHVDVEILRKMHKTLKEQLEQLSTSSTATPY